MAARAMPGAQEERAAILAEAVAFYESLLRLDSTDPSVRFETAQTYHRMSRLNNLAGQIDQADAAGRTAIQLLTELAEGASGSAGVSARVGRHCGMFYGHARLLNGDYEGGVAAYRACRAGGRPGERVPRRTQVSHGRGRMPAQPRLLLHRLSTSSCRGTFSTGPEAGGRGLHAAARADTRAILASVLGAYGSFLVNTRRLADAEKLLDRAAALVDPKAGPPPPGGIARMSYDQARLTTRYALALVYARTNRVDEAERLARDVAQEYESLLTGQPRAFPYRLQTVQAYALVAQLCERGKRGKEAAAASGGAVELLDGLLQDYPAFREMPKGMWLQQIRQNTLASHARNLLDAGSSVRVHSGAANIDRIFP